MLSAEVWRVRLRRATRAPDAEDAATTAMFYSITVPRPCFKVRHSAAEHVKPLFVHTCLGPHPAVWFVRAQGLDLAGMLLQRVMPALGSEMPGVTQFSTLSPMPLFLRWWHQSHVRVAPVPRAFPS